MIRCECAVAYALHWDCQHFALKLHRLWPVMLVVVTRFMICYATKQCVLPRSSPICVLDVIKMPLTGSCYRHTYAHAAQQAQLLNVCVGCMLVIYLWSRRIVQPYSLSTSNKLDWQNWHGVRTINPSDSFLLLHSHTATPAKRFNPQNMHGYAQIPIYLCLCSVQQTKTRECQMRQVLISWNDVITIPPQLQCCIWHLS